jgi:hypothetical protein
LQYHIILACIDEWLQGFLPEGEEMRRYEILSGLCLMLYGVCHITFVSEKTSQHTSLLAYPFPEKCFGAKHI